ncbi:MAG TPA: DUF2235 domain-containing protein [Sphingomicrobium sp.]|nr:DUF2235 domain-containing protein [Sphingomicrobium sp.]
MPKNIVICSDGTGNQINWKLSNVLKLFRVLQKSPDQIVYYSPGVGTVGDFDEWQQFKQEIKEVLGLATGYGLDENVLDAYRFLCTHYESGDLIWLFGFSRGAYTVRVLAAFIYVIGLLRTNQLNLADYAFTAYKKASHDSRKGGKLPEADALRIAATQTSEEEVAHGLPAAWEFARVAGTQRVTIKFIGVWDSVASVLVPRPDRLLLDFQMLRFTRTNPGVEIFRQAISIDERRRMFRLNRWTEPQTFKTNPFNNKNWRAQDIRQVWFAGVHGDVGGGYAESESGLSKFPLLWLINEAKAAGLKTNSSVINHLVLGKPRKDSMRVYVAPNARAQLHRSLKGLWWALEVIPKLKKFREWPHRRSLFGLYLPLGEPRPIPQGALIHKSVFDRIAQVPGYRPINLPSNYVRTS